MLASLVAPLAAAVSLAPAPLDGDGRLDADVAVVADRADANVVDAVRAAVFAAVRARGARVVDLRSLGLQRAVDECVDVGCRRDLARRRGAEWHVIVDDDGAKVGLALMDGETERAHVVLTGARVMLLGGVPDAVDALFEAALPRGVVDRERAVARARALGAAGDVGSSLAAWAEAGGLGADDRAIEIAFERARYADDVGDDAAVDAAWHDAESSLLDAPGVGAAGRAQLVAALLEHHWQRASRAAAIAEADAGPDHDALAQTAADLFRQIAGRPWVPDDVRSRAAEEAAALGPCSVQAHDGETPAKATTSVTTAETATATATATATTDGTGEGAAVPRTAPDVAAAPDGRPAE